MSNLQLSPWVSMWMSPRKTVRALIESNPKYRFWVLAFIEGWPLALYMAAITAPASLASMFLSSLVYGFFFGCLLLLLQSALVFITGKLLGGKATFIQVRCAVSWSNITSLLTCLSMLFLLFFSLFPVENSGEVRHLLIVPLLWVVALVWYGFLLVNAIAEVQGFSVWKALANVGLPLIALYVLLLVLGKILMYMQS